ncbi:hypothetical protein EUX98_g8221 [Antrodiella citrinella]|uniref:Trafficking protein particle complex subunit 13 n=1 Tax=Antrodiella citrinella TaxID=2447956 RepID=A0A4S4MAX9_9APHY|nr:hypothetical protein EUX98_g8221 [Antrodiella citrinella]
MASNESQSHLVSLKVMRVSRPTLTTAWEPFYSSSPSFSAHSTSSILSLQTKEPLPGHPNTLRDLTHVTEVLMLPAAFGAIQLGETFSGCIAVNNDSKTFDIEGVYLKVEMQTNTAKIVLAEAGGPDHRLTTADTMEDVVNYEIKELGQHVLACTVSYNVPEHIRHERPQLESVLSFRKFYKFQVTNPLSVKTKIHTPRCPSSLLSAWEREKVFLELHVQNLTQETMWLSKIVFECTENWTSTDSNGNKDGVTIFSGAMALMQPQDLRQYVYVLSPKVIPKFPPSFAPGSSIPLGKLHLEWRSSLGEPGRLSTSMLSRKIPLVEGLLQQQQQQQQPAPAPPPKQNVSAVPPYLQRSNTVGGVASPRAQSPSQRPMSPPISVGTIPAPYRPGSPFRNRTLPIQPRVQSPIPLTPNDSGRRPGEDVEVDLVVRNIPRDNIRVDQPFGIEFTLSVSAPVPPSPAGQRRKQRHLTLVVQHLEPPRPIPASGVPPPPTIVPGSWSPRLPSSGFSTPSPYGTPYRGEFPDNLSQKLLMASPRHVPDGVDSEDTDSEEGGDGRETARETPGLRGVSGTISSLPPPFTSNEESNDKKQDVLFLGTSTLLLPPIRLIVSEKTDTETSEGDDADAQGHARNVSTSTITTQSEADSELEVIVGGGRAVQVIISQDFELQYIPIRTGFATAGGLRVLLVADRLVDAEEADAIRHVRSQSVAREKVRSLREWGVIAEMWVQS